MRKIESVVPLEQKDIVVLRESIWHSVQRPDIPDKDRDRLYQLRDHLRNYLEE